MQPVYNYFLSLNITLLIYYVVLYTDVHFPAIFLVNNSLPTSYVYILLSDKLLRNYE
jgi:hypothetical protein